MITKNLSLTLSWLLVSFALTQSCQFRNRFLCLPDQYGCSDRGGKCNIQGGYCVCVPAHQFYDYSTSYGSPVGGNVQQQPAVNQQPFSEQNIEGQTKLWTSFSRFYNVVN